MSHPFTRIVTGLLLACVAAACSSDNSGYGSLNAGMLSLSIVHDNVVAVAGVHDGVYATGYDVADSDVALTMTSAGGEYSHTWDDASKFPQSQFYISGTYQLYALSGNPQNEGFDRPAFAGALEVNVDERNETQAIMSLSLANAFVRVEYGDETADYFTSAKVLLHTPGGGYHEYPAGESRLLCLNPGATDILIDLTLKDGRSVYFTAWPDMPTSAATLYYVTVGCDAGGECPEITVNTPSGSRSIRLSDSFVNAEAPVLESTWAQGLILDLPEGNTPEAPYEATLDSSSPLSSVVLSTFSKALVQKGMPSEVDLLHLTPSQADELRRLGLDFTLDATGGKVRLNRLFGNLVYLDEASAMSTFSIIATDREGRSSRPLTLTVDTSPVEIEVVNTYPVVMGINTARIDVKCDEPGFSGHVEIEIADGNGQWLKASPLDIESKGGGLYTVTFQVEEGSTPVEARVLYCDESRFTVTLQRRMPPFTIQVDAYATMAAVKIVPEDESLLTTITSGAHVYINGNEAPVYLDMPERGILTVIGLSPNTAYEFKATLMSGVESPQFTPSVNVVTEGTPQLPNADFEDRADGVKYKKLPSGGRYSQTVVEIYNWQHFTDFDREIPKHWANTNAKTFASASACHNTWYMQPSVALTRDPVFSQSFAVELTSVAFDPHGRPIPDYAQTGQPYLDYSPIIPEIGYRAAGRLFLGQYSFDPATMTEVYNEGMKWNSRPTSLNGYYRYYPVEADRSDCGLVTVELIGRGKDGDMVIASGSRRLTLALSYTAFSVPLTYTEFGIKATRIKVMFSSSVHTGSISEETRNVKTVSNPRTASSTGGKLWIDNVTLAY